MKRVLVVGATGPTGAFVTRELIRLRLQVNGTFRETGPTTTALENLLYFKADCKDSERMQQAAQGCDALVSCVHLSHAPHMLQAAQQAGIRRVVFFSSTRIYSAIPDPVIEELRKAEAQIRASGLDATIVRPTMIYGHENDRNLFPLFKKIGKSRIHLLPDGGRKLMQPVHVEDVAQAVGQVLLEKETIGKTIVLPGPSPISLNSVYLQLAAAQARRIFIVPVPLGLVEWVAKNAPASLLPKGVSVEAVQRLREDVVFSLAPTKALIPYAPRAFAEGIKSYSSHSTT